MTKQKQDIGSKGCPVCYAYTESTRDALRPLWAEKAKEYTARYGDVYEVVERQFLCGGRPAWGFTVEIAQRQLHVTEQCSSAQSVPRPVSYRCEDEDDGVRDEGDTCACHLCHCLNRTAFGICEDCRAGGHQG